MLRGKIITLAAASEHPLVVSGCVVLTNGCFDILHAGHVLYLEQARQMGDLLFVALNDDASVRRLKGQGRPLNSAADRATVLAGLESVDFVFPFEGDTVASVLRAVRPNVWAKGGDYTLETLNPVEVGAANELGIAIRLVPLVKGKSTTGLLNRSLGVDFQV